MEWVSSLAAREDLTTQPTTVRGSAIIAGPQLYVTAVVLQKGKVPIVVEACSVVVLSLKRREWLHSPSSNGVSQLGRLMLDEVHIAGKNILEISC